MGFLGFYLLLMEDVERADSLLFLLRLDGFRRNGERTRVFLDVEL